MTHGRRELVTAEGLANTYDPPIDDMTGWDLVQQHQDALDYAAEHPSAGSYKIASAVEAPRSRVREWFRGDNPAVPDAARGVNRAIERGWLPVTLDVERPFRAWNRLVAATLAGGSLNRQFVPSWSPSTKRERNRIREALQRLKVNSRFEHRNQEGEIQADGSAPVGTRPVEIVPIDQAPLGRILIVLGCPTGRKSKTDCLGLPGYLGDAPTVVRTEFATAWVGNRAEERYVSGDEYGELRLRANWRGPYVEQLADLLSDVTGIDVSVNKSGLFMPSDARAELVSMDRFVEQGNPSAD